MILSDGSAVTLRSCLRNPIPQVADAARYLDAAVTAHLQGRGALAEELIRAADMDDIRKWTKSIWADSTIHLVAPEIREQPTLRKELRGKSRMPTGAEKERIHQRDGYNCRFCGMTIIRREIRTRMKAIYPNAVTWGPKEADQHAASRQCGPNTII